MMPESYVHRKGACVVWRGQLEKELLMIPLETIQAGLSIIETMLAAYPTSGTQ